ncbi:TlpA disulfide reductase family protein [Kordiimonas lacus]|uniref:Thiol-disulfide isomerase or thioredoxin n=1 Tax=Kordiimonas lacus TaxID=637679 RepID=A0A1G6XS44_9PROT|nr:TlpA disulfide reductase family protein [Kordiimonas lacus]SDD80791.1 Thiol-disulfide isomerase or thioredoxin [Kordiimonas lacus]
MPKKALLPAVILVVLLGAAAYRLFLPSTTSFPADAPINSYLKGEMAKLSLPEEPKGLTDHIIMREDGSPIKLSAMKGKAMLINLWASWCAPCRAEMHELANLQRELGDDTFEVVAITVDRGGVLQAKDTLEEWGVEGLNLYAEPTMAIALELADGKLPTSYIIGADGQVKAYFLGPLKWDTPDAIALFTALKNGEI